MQNASAKDDALDVLAKTLGKSAAKQVPAAVNDETPGQRDVICAALRALYARRVRHTTLNQVRTFASPGPVAAAESRVDFH